jgi:hypothetical protein
MRWFFLLLPGLCVLSSVLFAEIVTEVGTDGTLTLASGKQVALVGVQMDTEGISVLRVLTQKQDLKLQLIAHPTPGAKEFAYAYLQAKYLKFPAKLNEIPDEQEVLINEFLVKIGAAKVVETQDFSRKAQFLKVQEEARKKGEGIWSYEVP